MTNIEERLSKLEETNAALLRQKAQLQGRAEISDLMGKYALYFSANEGKRLFDELWSQKDDIRLEYGASGIFAEKWKIMLFYIHDQIPGRLSTVSFSSPSIVIHEDGNSAVGRWDAFATETDAGDLSSFPVEEESNRRLLLSSRTEDGRQFRAEVLLQRYEVVFRREENGWKIWKLHVIEIFRCPFDRDWVTFAQERFETDGIWLESMFESPMPVPEHRKGEHFADLPSSFHWQYTVDRVPELSE